jgi:glycosyltransferase involved in cell wall biosynthesis
MLESIPKSATQYGENSMLKRTSVIIPCYNGEAYLGEALESVCSQTRAAREIIVVDDGSTRPIQRPTGWTDPPLRIVRTQNRGLPAARNLAISLASGEFVALLDADDAWHVKKIELQEDALVGNPGAVASFTQITEKPGWLPGPVIPYPDPNATINELMVSLWRRNFMTPSTMMIRRQSVLDCGGFDERLRFYEDWEFWFRLLGKGAIIQVPQPLCYYRRHPNQMTKDAYRMTKYFRQALIRIIEHNGTRLELAGIRRSEQLDTLRQDYRSRVLLLFFQRHLWAARLLLWKHLFAHPGDLELAKYALLSFLPRWLLIRLRDQGSCVP